MAANSLYNQAITGFSTERSNYTVNAPNIFTPSGGTGTVLYQNKDRIAFYVQNLDGTSPLYLKLGVGASVNSFNYILKKNTAQNAGDGGELYNKEWKGPVSVSGANTQFIAWEIS